MLRREAARNMKRKNDEPDPHAPKRPRTETPQAIFRRNLFKSRPANTLPRDGKVRSVNPPAPDLPSTSTGAHPSTHFELLNQAVSDSLEHGPRAPPIGLFDVRPRRKSSPFPVQRNNGALSREAPPRRVRSMPNIDNKTRHVQSTQATPALQYLYDFPIPLKSSPTETQASISAVVPRNAIHNSDGRYNGYSPQVGSKDAIGSAITFDTIIDVPGFDIPFDPDLLRRLDEELGPLPLDFDFHNDPLLFAGDLCKVPESNELYPATETLTPVTQYQVPGGTEGEAPLPSATIEDSTSEKSFNDIQDADLHNHREPTPERNPPSAETRSQNSNGRQEEKKLDLTSVTRENAQSRPAESECGDVGSTRTQASVIDYKSLFNHNVVLFQTDTRPLGQYFGQDFWSSENEFPTLTRSVGKAIDKSHQAAHSLTVSEPRMVGASTTAFWERYLSLLRWSRNNRESFASVMAQGTSYTTAMSQHLPKQVNDWIRGALLTNLTTLYGNAEGLPQTLSKDDVKVAREAALALVEYEIDERHSAIVEQWERRRRLPVASCSQGQASSQQSIPNQDRPAKRCREADDPPPRSSGAPDHGRPQKRARRPSPLSQVLTAVNPKSPPKQEAQPTRKFLSSAKSARNAPAGNCRSTTQRQQSWEPSTLDFPQLPPLDVASSGREGATNKDPAAGLREESYAKTNDTTKQTIVINDGVPVLATEATDINSTLFDAWEGADIGPGYLSSEELKKLIDDLF